MNESGSNDHPGTAEDFERECWLGVQRCKALKPPYNPTIWIDMMHRYGAVEAAKRLLVNGDIQSGFERLLTDGHPEMTVEWMVCEDRWSHLFSRDHIAASRWRLEQAGYRHP
jgi:hypothetical protein